MIVMFIFLFLTIVFIIATVIYLNYKKKNTNKPIKVDVNNTIDKENNKKRKKNIADIFNIKIKDNILCLGNRYSIILTLGNIDYNMLSNSEQDAIESLLIQTALSIDFPIQFFSTTEYIDTSKVISLIKSNKTSNVRIKEYQENLTNYLQNLMENKNISVIKNYAIISYDGLYDSALEELNRQAISFKNNLLRAKIVCEILTEDEIYNLIYRELNKNSSLNISSLKEGGNLYVGKTQKTKRNKHI